MSALRKKLAPTWFSLPVEQSPAPEFELAPLRPLEWLEVRNEIYQTPAGLFKISARGVRTALEAAVRNWRYVVDEDGNPVEFDRRLLFDLPAEWLDDLATEVAHRSLLSESERKN